MQAQKRSRAERPPSLQLDYAQSREEIRQALREEPIEQQGLKRLIFNPDGKVQVSHEIKESKESQESHESQESKEPHEEDSDILPAGNHPEGTVVIRFVGRGMPRTLVAVQMDQFEQQIKTAYFILTNHLPDLDTITVSTVPLEVVDWKNNDLSGPARTFPVKRSITEFPDKYMINTHDDSVTSVESVIPIVVSEKRILPKRVAQTIPFYSGKLKRDTQQEAWEKSGEYLEFDEEEQKEFQEEFVESKAGKIQTAVIQSVLEPLVYAFQKDPSESIEVFHEQIEEAIQFIQTNMNKPGFYQSLLNWAIELSNRDRHTIGPHVIWPFIHWVEHIIDKSSEHSATLKKLKYTYRDKEPVETVAFQTVKTSGDDEILNWCACDHCGRFRLVKTPVSEDNPEPWVCGTEGIDLRGFPDYITDQMTLIRNVRSQLKNQMLPTEKRASFAAQENKLCQEMCTLLGDEEEDEDARERLEDYFKTVVLNTEWETIMKKTDDIMRGMHDLQEEAEESVPPPKGKASIKRRKRRILIDDEDDDEHEDKQYPDPDTERKEEYEYEYDSDEKERAGILSKDRLKIREQLRQGIGTKYEPACSIHMGEEGGVKDDIDYYKCLMEDAKREIHNLLSSKKTESLTEKEKTELKTLQDDIAQWQEIIQEKESLAKHDPNFSKRVPLGEQNDVRILKALSKPEYESGVSYIQIAKDLGAHNQTINKIINPRGYKFIGVKGSLLGSGIIFLSTSKKDGFYVHRRYVQSPEDVERLIEAQRERERDAFQESKLRNRLQLVIEQNRILPYILGGAFLLYALNPEITDVSELKKLTVKYFPGLQQSPEDLDFLIETWKNHLSMLMGQKKKTPQEEDKDSESDSEDIGIDIGIDTETKDDPKKMKALLLKAARRLENVRITNEPTYGIRYPWWIDEVEWIQPVEPTIIIDPKHLIKSKETKTKKQKIASVGVSTREFTEGSPDEKLFLHIKDLITQSDQYVNAQVFTRVLTPWEAIDLYLAMKDTPEADTKLLKDTVKILDLWKKTRPRQPIDQEDVIRALIENQGNIQGAWNDLLDSFAVTGAGSASVSSSLAFSQYQPRSQTQSHSPSPSSSSSLSQSQSRSPYALSLSPSLPRFSSSGIPPPIPLPIIFRTKEEKAKSKETKH